MSNKTLVIMRGLPGSGKSTRAKSFGGKIFSTDDFFMKDGKYNFNIKLIGIAHKWNQDRVAKAAEKDEPVIVVDNTNTTSKEMEPYLEIAAAFGYKVELAEPDSEWWVKNFKKNMSVEEKKAFAKILSEKNVHGVPEEVILKMIERWEFK